MGCGVFALTVYDGKLIAGGWFKTAEGGSPTTSSWSGGIRVLENIRRQSPTRHSCCDGARDILPELKKCAAPQGGGKDQSKTVLDPVETLYRAS